MRGPWLFWFGAWLLACAFVVVLLRLRRAPTIWRGSSVLGFTFALAVIAIVTTVAGESDDMIPLSVAMAVVLLGSWLLRHHALVSGHSLEEIGNAIEGSARRVNLRSRPVAGGYELTLPEGVLTLMLWPLTRRVTLITMRPAPSNRKAQLFAQLFAKQYRGVLPTIVIRAS